MLPRICASALVVLVLLTHTSAQAQIEDSKKVPFNPQVVKGKLAGDIPFYILKNAKPERRLDLILTVNAGAVLEDDDQDGLAHFCEHMAFNGTKEFPKQALVSFLESTGIRFGADLNAYTNQDETVYMLTLPITNVNNIINGVKVLRDWAAFVSYDDAEIEAERGVVMEEWRLGRGAEERVREKHFPAMFNGSKYEQRDVIGDTNVLRGAAPDVVRRFYKKWYRPENFAVIAVGDIEPHVLTEILQKYFVVPTDNAGGEKSIRTPIPIPFKSTTTVSIASDKELQHASCEILIRRPADTVVTYGQFRRQIANRLANTMLNARFAELTQKAKPPFSQAFVSTYNLSRETVAFYANVTAADKNVLGASSAMMTELLRVKQHGFTETELKRAKDQISAQMESMYNDKDKTESQGLAFELLRHVLQAESVPGITHETEIYRHYLPLITASECTDYIIQNVHPENQVVMYSVPEGNGYTLPKEQQVLDLMAAVSAKKIDAYVDKVPTKPLMASAPQPGGIVKDEFVKELDARKLTLTNGATVYLKKTDYKNDEIVFEAMAFGGQSLGADADHMTLSSAAQIVDASGIADIPTPELTKMLQGKNLSLSPFISMETQGLRGNTTPKDMQTFMELLHLYFTAPRIDDEAVASWKTRMKSQLDNKEKSPESALFDTLMYVMASHHVRAKPLTAESLNSVDPAKALAFYKSRFANAAGFTFSFVGNYDEKTMDDFVKTYIASLPGNPKAVENWKDVGMKTQRGKISKEVKKGEEPKSFVVLVYDGNCKYEPKSRYDAIALCEVMTIRLREQLREEASGVYFVQAQPQVERIPNEEYSIAVIFSCDPKRVEELTAIVEKEASYLKSNLVDDTYIQKVKEIQIKEREVSRKTNGFWLRNISQIVESKEPPTIVEQRDKLISNLNSAQVKAAAQQFLNPENFAKFSLKPATN